MGAGQTGREGAISGFPRLCHAREVLEEQDFLLPKDVGSGGGPVLFRARFNRKLRMVVGNGNNHH
jgi:hypothetical protein